MWRPSFKNWATVGMEVCTVSTRTLVALVCTLVCTLAQTHTSSHLFINIHIFTPPPTHMNNTQEKSQEYFAANAADTVGSSAFLLYPLKTASTHYQMSHFCQGPF
jgi:hypothetical protein